MRLAHLLEKYTSDFRAIIDAYGVNLKEEDHGKTGLKVMHLLLGVARRNRAYDDSHPGFASGQWKRVLPFDGSEYCEYYANGCNDSHLETLLKRIKESLMA